MTLIPVVHGDIDVRGSDRTEMTSCITGANIKTDQWPVKRYSGRKGHSATKNHLPRAYRVAFIRKRRREMQFYHLLLTRI